MRWMEVNDIGIMMRHQITTDLPEPRLMGRDVTQTVESDATDNFGLLYSDEEGNVQSQL